MTEYTISIRDQICPNKRCSFYGEKPEGNIVVHGRKYPRFKCIGCKKTWVHSYRHIRYGLRKGIQKFELALKLFSRGISVRKIAQEVGVNPGTIQRWKKKTRLFKSLIY